MRDLILISVSFLAGYVLAVRRPKNSTAERPRESERKPEPTRETELPPAKCADGCCNGIRDPRCAGGNCTHHCQSIIGCQGRCLNLWKSTREDEIRRERLERTKTETFPQKPGRA